MKIFASAIMVLLGCKLFAQHDKKSELANVMVQMLQYLKTEKANVMKQKMPQTIPASFSSIHVALPTAGKKLTPDHKELSDNFLQLLGSYHAHPQNDMRKNAFNAVVKSCIACHEKVCPGPIAAIEKNFVD